MEKGVLFKNLHLSLRTEIILNISFLMLAAILLIGFTVSKINEKRMIEQRIKDVEGMIPDLQSMIDFITRDMNDASLALPGVKKEIQEFGHIYTRERGLHDLVIVDLDSRVIASKKEEWLDKDYSDNGLKKTIQTGEPSVQIDKVDSLLSTEYRKLILYSPLWIKGKTAGAIQMIVPVGNIMKHLAQSQRIVLISIILDALVLIIFGSFLLSRVLVRPIKDLVRLTQKISEGDFSQIIEVSSKNEIGQLVVSFNRMSERLKENKTRLEDHLISLETTNKKLRQTQEELVRTEKLASIGRFAAGIAHEVGNPLGAILGYTGILQQEGLQAEESKDYLKRIEKEIERINNIVRELLDFARPTRHEIKPLDVNQAIENTVSLLSYQKNFKDMETLLDLKRDLPMIQGDESQLSQVLMNVIINAVDAMPKGGILKIQTDESRVEDSLGDLFPQIYSPRRKSDPIESNYSRLRKADSLSTLFTKVSEGEHLVRIRVSDTGTGIRTEDLERIFDPFFTTKSPDKGTGLGLSVSLRIIESMGGEIKVNSEVGTGTTVEIYFPVAQ
jgi:hypothetical protein